MKTSEWALIQHDQSHYKKKFKPKETPDTRACRGTTVGKHKRKMATCKPRRAASEETNPATTLISEFQPQEL